MPHIFDLGFTTPFGWSGTVFALEDFVTQAVRQHFPRTLQRVPGVDFRLPTPEETAAMIAFMQSMSLVPDGVLQFDFTPLVRTAAQARGQALFFGNAKCFECHNGPLLTDNASFDTGVTRRPINLVPPPECDPPCTPLGGLPRIGGRAWRVWGLASVLPCPLRCRAVRVCRWRPAYRSSPW